MKTCIIAILLSALTAGCSAKIELGQSPQVDPSAQERATNELYPFQVTTDGKGHFSFRDTSCDWNAPDQWDSCEQATEALKRHKVLLNQEFGADHKNWQPYTCK